MLGVLKATGRWGGIAAIILLVITLLKQLIALVGFLTFFLKAIIVFAFVALVLVMVVLLFRTRGQRRREAEEL